MKRSLALTAALLLPLFPALANVAHALQSGLGRAAADAEFLTPWFLYGRYAFKLWTIFALPVIVAILSALLANVDHGPKAWKQLLALAFPRSLVFAGKWAALAGLTLLSTLVFALVNVWGGGLVHFLRPELGLDFPIPVGELIFRPFLGWLLAMLMLSLHLWLSLRWPSFLISITAGFAASVSNIFLVASQLFTRSAFSPWAMPVQAYGNWQLPLIVSLAGAALVYLLARREFVRRDVY
jgi:hypothetical protein